MYKFKFLNALTILLILLQAVLPIPALAMASAASTDLPDYTPGSVVTFSGDSTYQPDETVHVDVNGPNSYADSCEATVGADGVWSCQVALPADAADGNYAWAATGTTSGTTDSGAFTVTTPPPPATQEPTQAATGAPTATEPPTQAPTATEPPTVELTQSPTDAPTQAPTSEPTQAPSPTAAPVLLTPFITSNKADYAPAELVTLTSGNWQPGEWVVVFVNDNIGQTWSITTNKQADASGAFIYQFNLPNWFVATYNVTATGAASGAATSTFTDASGPNSTLMFPSQNSYYNDAGWDAGCASAGACGTATGGGTGQTNFNLTGINVSIQKGTGGPATCWGGSSFNHTTCPFYVAGTLLGSGHGPVNWSFAFGHANFPEENQYKIIPQAVDTSGTESGNNGKSFFIDRTGPSSAITCNAAACSGTYSGNVTVVLSASDPTLGSTGIAGSGVQKINYTTDGSDPTSSVTATTISGSSGSFSISTSKTVKWAAYDNAGNVGSIQSQSITITPADSTPPVITPNTSGTLGNNGWYTSNVTLSWTVTDPESTVTSTSGCGTTSINTDTSLAGTTLTCSATSAGGPNSQSVTIKRDATAPSVTITPDHAPNANSWYNSTIKFTVSGSDALSGGVTCGSIADYSGPDSSSASVSATCTDAAGNTGSNLFGFKYDATAPINVIVGPDRSADSNGYYNHAFTATWSGTDTTSGIDTCTQTTYSGTDTNNGSLNGTCTDKAGNTSGSVAFTFKYDATAPNVTITPERNADSNGWYNHTVKFTATGSDGFSDSVTCGSIADYSGPDNGSASVSATCTDAAGNTGSNLFGFKYDATAPSVSVALDRPADHNGWYNANVDYTVTSSDATSGSDTCTPNGTYSGPDSATASVTAKCTDKAGNSNSDTVNFQFDKTAPSLSGAPTTAPNANGWYKGDVIIQWTCGDTLSGISGSCPADSTITGEGTALTASASVSDLAGNTTNATSSPAVKIDRTAPSASASASPAANANGWNNTDVTVSFSGTDGLSGIGSCSTPVVLSNEGAGQSASGTCTDKAGNVSASATASGINIDKTAPTNVIVGPDRPADKNGYYNHGFTATWSGEDALSDIDSCTVTDYSGPDTNIGSLDGTCTDQAGNTSGAVVFTFKYDATAPTSVSGAPNRAADHNGWYNHAVDVVFTGNDATSGIDTCTTVNYNGPDGSGLTVNGSCTDKAGNASASVASSAFDYDATKPDLNITGSPSGSSNVCSALPGRPTFAPTDNLSGIDSHSDSWQTPSAPSGVGAYTYTATATDLAGNTTSETRTYSVNYGGSFSGYLQPINTDGSSRFKLGSTVPVKFQLKCGTTPITNAVAKLFVGQTDTKPDTGIDEAISTAAATTGNLFRYDTTAQQYIFNLSTKLGYTNPGSQTPVQFTTGTWYIKILLDDGSWYNVQIQLPK